MVTDVMYLKEFPESSEGIREALFSTPHSIMHLKANGYQRDLVSFTNPFTNHAQVLVGCRYRDNTELWFVYCDGLEEIEEFDHKDFEVAFKFWRMKCLTP
jgi:hypothetical protein